MWQPIETAPRDQIFLAVLNCAGVQTICTMHWRLAEAKNSRPDSKTFHVERVTHWMPLPDLPGAKDNGAQNVPSVSDDIIRGSTRLLKRASGHLRWLKKDTYQWHCLNPKTMRAAELLHRDIDAMLAAQEAKP